MNNDRRKRLNEAADLLRECQERFERAKELVSECASEERDAYDNLTEGLQAAERGQRMEEVASELESIESDIEVAFEDLISRIESCTE